MSSKARRVDSRYYARNSCMGPPFPSLIHFFPLRLSLSSLILHNTLPTGLIASLLQTPSLRLRAQLFVDSLLIV